MVIIDANPIIRVIMNDDNDMVSETKKLLRTTAVLLKNEVIAEIVYVLLKVYRISRTDIFDFITKFIKAKNIRTESDDILEFALNTFKSENLDFVDCLLYAYYSVGGNEIFTFDKTLLKLIGEKEKRAENHE
jgi:predicted nucleic-acid-binding protein